MYYTLLIDYVFSFHYNFIYNNISLVTGEKEQLKIQSFFEKPPAMTNIRLTS